MVRTSGRGGYGQLLLLAALLFGIVTMHTLGHPSDGHGAGASASAEPAAMGHGAHSGQGVHAGPASESTSEPHGMTGMGMDPLSVCLAVLGAFTLVLLVRAGLLRLGGTLARAPATGHLPNAPRPEAPPPRVLLARLSVLRI
ncbi:DUF6153 family protein [Streptomyces sp. NPDC003006]